MLPLEGIRVLDVTQIMAGPLCGSYLGDMGADVIKVELPTGDSVRAGANSLAFLASNRSKRGIAIDYKTSEGVEALLRLSEGCDVFIENSRPGAAKRRGYGYEEVKQRNASVVYCSISAFGQTGPYSHKPAVDWIVQGISGAMSWTGPYGGDPVRVGPMVCDFSGAIMAAYGISMALMARARDGVGQKVDVSLLDSTMHVLGQRLLEWPMTGNELRPMGTMHPWNAPHETFKTRDGALNIGIQEEHRWATFCEAMGVPELTDDPRFCTSTERVANALELHDILQALFLKESTRTWLDRLEAADQYVGPVQSLREVISDPQIVHNGIIVDVDHPEIDNLKLIDNPVRLSETPVGIQSRPPLLGEHTFDVLREAGFSDDEVAGLRQNGVIGGPEGSEE